MCGIKIKKENQMVFKKKNWWKRIDVLSLMIFIIFLSGCDSNQEALAGKGYYNNIDYNMDIAKESWWENPLEKFGFKINQEALIKRLIGGTLRPVSWCGDGLLQEGEQCEDGNRESFDGCDSECLCEPYGGCQSICGDWIIVMSEECDDGNLIDHDGCSSLCRIEPLECGNGIMEVGEECDSPDRSVCTEACTLIACGDGVIEGFEECDSPDRSVCTENMCTLIVCGDGILEGDEECEIPAPGCTAECTWAVPRTCVNCNEEAVECAEYTTLDSFCREFDSLDSCAAGCVPRPREVPPEERDDALCRIPVPFDLPEGVRYRNAEGGARHISTCDVLPEECPAEDCARYTICDLEGTRAETVSIIPCPPGSPCVDGACQGDPTWFPRCFDSDGDISGGISPFTRGEVTEYGPEGERTMGDYCHYSYILHEQYCIDGTFAATPLGINCQSLGEYYCNRGACVEGPVTCMETDDGDDPLNPGILTISSPAESFSISDSCNFFRTGLTEMVCVEGPEVHLYLNYDCNTDIDCGAESCYCDLIDGVATCLPGEPPVLECEDRDGEDIFNRGWAGLRNSFGSTIGDFDSCVGLSIVGEMVCPDRLGRSIRIPIPCPEEYLCFGGACHPEAACREETIAGIHNVLARDESEGDWIYWPDTCTGDILQIYGCAEDHSAYLAEEVDCTASGMTCVDYRCVLS